MEAAIDNGTGSRKMVWSGRALSSIAVLFMLFDSIPKIMKNESVLKASAPFGYPEYLIPVIGQILLVCLILYVVPRTSILGAVLLTGYLGGAVAANMRIESPLFGYTLFPVYIGILVWGGVYFCDERARALLSPGRR